MVYTASKSFRQNPHSTFYYHNKKSHICSQKSLVTVCSLFNHPRSRYLRSVPQLHLIIQQNLLHPEAPYKYPAWKHHDPWQQASWHPSWNSPAAPTSPHAPQWKSPPRKHASPPPSHCGSCPRSQEHTHPADSHLYKNPSDHRS